MSAKPPQSLPVLWPVMTPYRSAVGGMRRARRFVQMTKQPAACLLLAGLLAAGVPDFGAGGAVLAQGAHSVNAGDRQAQRNAPFSATEVARFSTPWAIAFLPDGRMLVTEKPGRIFLVTPAGEKAELAQVPKVAARGQNGLLDIAPAPDFARSGQVYLSYTEAAQGGSRLVLARARLAEGTGGPALDGLQVIWRQGLAGQGGQPGGIIAFAPDHRHLFLTLGDRMAPATAQDPDAPAGKLLRLTLEGGTPADNPQAQAGGTRGQSWSIGHRNPYGLAFAPDGSLWLSEHGPRGGDELNRIEAGQNYGWPEVSNGDNYNGTPIPDHDSRSEFTAPAVYWNPVIAPGGMAFYEGAVFPDWRGSLLIAGLKVQALVRVAVQPDGSADEVDRWAMGGRMRDVAVAPDGAVWVIEDADPGRLMRLVPKG